LLLYRASRPHTSVLGKVPGTRSQYADRDRHPENEAVPGAILRIESGLFFANADAVRASVRAHAADATVHAVVLDAESIAFVDITAVRMLQDLADDLARSHVQLAVAHEIGQVRDVIRSSTDAPDGIPVYPTPGRG
jgi:MFS superfamily sulfate permease-like transporter